jgi:hypothetical protein
MVVNQEDTLSKRGGVKAVNNPQEEAPSLEELMHRAALALEEAGVTAQDLLDELPIAGIELMRREYGDAFVDELERIHTAAQHT